MKKTYYILMLFIMPIFARCQPQNLDEKLNGLLEGSVELINSTEAATIISIGNNVILYDTRSTEEFSVSAIKNANFIDYDNFDPLTIDMPNINDTLIFYCTVGYRSEKIGEKFKALGYSNVFNLYGGILEWKNNGNPVYNSKLTETDSVHTYSKSWGQWLKEGVRVYE